MPPFDLWLRGRDDILTWWFGPGIGCRGSRVLPRRRERLAGVRAVQARPTAGFEPWALQVVELEDGRIVEMTFFLDTERLFPLFGLPAASTRSRYVREDVLRPMKATSSRSSVDAPRSRTVQPCRRAPSWRRASASTVTASGSIPATSHSATSAPLRPSSAQTRSQSPGGRPGRSGPRIANVSTGRGHRGDREKPIHRSNQTRDGSRKLIGGAADEFCEPDETLGIFTASETDQPTERRSGDLADSAHAGSPSTSSVSAT